MDEILLGASKCERYNIKRWGRRGLDPQPADSKSAALRQLSYAPKDRHLSMIAEDAYFLSNQLAARYDSSYPSSLPST